MIQFQAAVKLPCGAFRFLISASQTCLAKWSLLSRFSRIFFFFRGYLEWVRIISSPISYALPSRYSCLKMEFTCPRGKVYCSEAATMHWKCQALMTRKQFTWMILIVGQARFKLQEFNPPAMRLLKIPRSVITQKASSTGQHWFHFRSSHVKMSGSPPGWEEFDDRHSEGSITDTPLVRTTVFFKRTCPR